MATSGEATSAAGARARWRAGWRIALRLARRDVRSHRGRRALIVILVGLPVLLLSAGLTLLAMNDTSPAESVTRVMGQAQALIPVYQRTSPQRVQQDAVGQGSGSSGSPAKAVPGYPLDGQWTAAKVHQLTGGTVLTLTEGTVRVRMNHRRIRAEVLGIDGRKPATAGIASLTSGRWPASKDEVLITPAGIEHGLPDGGSLTVTMPDGAERTITVVGHGTGWEGANQKADLMGMPGDLTNPSDLTAFLVDRRAPVRWSDVKNLNAYGLVVRSRAVFLDPSDAEADPAASSMSDGNSAMTAVILLVAVGIFIETTLLAGPAFAVSAARQRRSLALAASNGADARQLRRYVIGQAVVLGLVSAAVAAAAGAGLAAAGLAWWSHLHPAFVAGPFDLPWLQLIGLFACASTASLVAAYFPARGISRIDLVGILRGHVSRRPIHAGWPVAGALLAVAGAVVVFGSLAVHGREVGVALGTIPLFAGVLMLIPSLLSIVGRLGGRSPLPLRIAARDTGRQRGRSAPTVAAIMAAVAVLTALSIGATSDNAQGARDYQPQLASGHAQVMVTDSQAEASARRTIATVAPQLIVTEPTSVGTNTLGVPGRPDSQRPTIDIAAQLAGGSPEDTLNSGFRGDQQGAMGCASLGSNSVGEGGTEIRVLSAAELARQLHLTRTQRQLLDHGGVLVADNQLAIVAGTVTFLRGSTPWSDAEPKPATVVGKDTVPAAAVPARALLHVFPSGSVGAVVTPHTAAALHWPTTARGLELAAPDGPITAEVEQALTDHFDDGVMLYVERGYQNRDSTMLLVLFTVFGLLVLVATLISTALTQAESRPDMATLAAVGATRRLRRKVAGSQAFVVGLAGSLLGLLVGLVPGIAITWPLTAVIVDATGRSTEGGPPTIVIPWLPLASVVIGVPLVAAALSAIAIRRAPEVTRRTA